MRTFVLVLCLALVVAACGDDDAVTTTVPDAATTSSTTVTTTPTTTTTTTSPAIPVVASLCVVGAAPGETVAVRAGVGDSFALVGELPYDATGVGTTGVTATNDADEAWTEIVFEGATAWVASGSLTAGPCDVGTAALWSVVDIACDSLLNVRTGHGDGYEILGTLEPDAFDLAGTGVTALDAQDRTWVQIEFEGGIAWVAGWFLTDEPGPSIDCSIPEFPWILTATALGPIELGSAAADLADVTGLEWTLQNGANTCEWLTNDAMTIAVEVQSGIITEIWALDPAVAITPEGIRVGDAKADVGAAYFGRAVLVPGPFFGTNILVDGVNYAANWTYLFEEDPFDEDRVGTIRINDDGGFIEGGCT